MFLQRFLVPVAVALAGVGSLLVLHVFAQNVPGPQPASPYIIEHRPDGTFVERTGDGKIVRDSADDGATAFRYQTVVQQLPDGRTVQRLVQVPMTRGSATAPDSESQKLIEQEQALAREVRRLTDNLRGIDGTSEAKQAEWKAEAREKLAAIFDLQQQRRTREIAKIEERLGKLKEVLKKRDTAKDSIVDRRLETLTGGVDELGWEESIPTIEPPYTTAPGRVPTFFSPPNVPQAGPAPVPPGAPVPPPAGPAADPVPVPPPTQPRR